MSSSELLFGDETLPIARSLERYLVALTRTFPLKLRICRRPPPPPFEVPSSMPRPSRPAIGRPLFHVFSMLPVIVWASISRLVRDGRRRSIDPLCVSKRRSPPAATSPEKVIGPVTDSNRARSSPVTRFVIVIVPLTVVKLRSPP